MEAMRKWLRQQLLDADEESRTWRLRAIQAEAELRALQVDVPGSPKMESLDSESGDTGGAGSEQAASLNKPKDLQVILSQVLGFEKHLEEWEPWRAKLLEEIQVAKTEAQKLQVLLDAQKAELPRAEREAKETSQEARSLQEERAKVKAAHDARCSLIAQEIHELLLNAGVRRVGESLVSLQQGEAALEAIQSSTRQLDDDVKETAQKREELCMRLEELKTRHLNNMETRAKSARDVQGARQALQSRQSILTKMQGEVSRSRARSERKKKQLEAQLAQSLLEMKDAKGRMDSADDALRKVRHQHSKQLRSVKSQTSSLQAEVDAHIQASEAAEQEMQELRERESELESSERHFVQQEEDLRQQAIRAKERLSSLEQETERFEDERRTLIEELQPLEEEWEQVELQAKALQDLADADVLKAKEHQSAAVGCREEIDAHLREFAAQADELTMLSSLEADAADLRKRRDQLITERTALEDASKASLQSLDQQMSDLREAQRRSTQLKAAHDDFVKLLPPSSLRQVGMSVAAEQSLIRISRKAEQLQSYFEGPGRASSGSGPPGSARRTTRPSGSRETLATTSGRLAEQLMEAAETIVKDELKESRQTLLDLQQKLADGSSKRGQEILSLRSQRRQLEEDLCRVEATVHRAGTESAALIGELERQLKELQDEAANDEACVAAEFSDSLQQQILERDALRLQVEELRRAEAEEAAKSELAAAALLDREEAKKRMKDLEKELAQLQAEEEELVQAHVTLKAALMGSRASSVPRTTAQGHRDVRPRPLSLPADRSKASTPGSEEPPRPRSHGAAATQVVPAQTVPSASPSQASNPSNPSNPAASPRTLRRVQMLRAHSQGQLLMPTTSRRSGYSGSDASSRVQAVSPETSPRMVRGAPLTASLPALAHVGGHRISPTPTLYARTAVTSMTMPPRQWHSFDKLVYTWPRQCQTPGPGTFVTLAQASAVPSRTVSSEFRTL